IDYYLAGAPEGEIKLEILDSTGAIVRTFTSAANPGDEPVGAAAEPADDDEGGPRIRSGPTRLDKSAGLHRFTWDLRYPGIWMNPARPSVNGPAAVPGKYSLRLIVGSWSSTQPLTVIEDPRIAKSGVTNADLKEQFDHNIRVRDLVTQVNQAVAR